MSLTVKVYLEKDGNRPEIRRFAIDQDVSTSYAYMQKKVAQVFPGLETKPFTMYWKDPEDDYITFSSDNELFEALSQLREDLFRVYVKVNEATEEKVHHRGVVCDACDGAVYGVRFKCSVCPDYDLCESCADKGLHKEHEMIRICTPATPWMNFMPPHFRGRKGCHSFRRHGRGPHGPGPHGQCPHPEGPGPHGPGPHGPGPHGPGPHGPGPHWGFPPHFRHWMHQAMHNIWNFPPPPQENDKQNEGQNGSDSQHAANEEEKENIGADYLRTVGETVAAMLDPMGIDVEIDVEHGNKSTRIGKNGQQNQKKRNEEDVNDVEMKEGSSASDVTAPKSSAETVVKKQSAAAENVKIPKEANQQGKDHADGDWTILQGGNSDSPPAPSTSNQSGSASAAQAGNAVYPSLPPETTDPRIAELLVQMEAMGFNNEGGWLTQLLIAKEGDIGKVLDALQPVKNA